MPRLRLASQPRLRIPASGRVVSESFELHGVWQRNTAAAGFSRTSITPATHHCAPRPTPADSQNLLFPAAPASLVDD